MNRSNGLAMILIDFFCLFAESIPTRSEAGTSELYQNRKLVQMRREMVESFVTMEVACTYCAYYSYYGYILYLWYRIFFHRFARKIVQKNCQNRPNEEKKFLIAFFCYLNQIMSVILFINFLF